MAIITNASRRTYGIPGASLQPGRNVVKDSVWMAAQGHRMVVALLKLGVIAEEIPARVERVTPPEVLALAPDPSGPPPFATGDGIYVATLPPLDLPAEAPMPAGAEPTEKPKRKRRG